MIKIIGVIMIISSTSAIGISLSRDINKRIRGLKDHISALQIIKAEIFYKNTPLDAIFEVLEKNVGPMTSGFYKITFEQAKIGLTFSTAAEKNLIILKKEGLETEDIDAIRRVCLVLGKYDGATQTETINKTIELLEKNLNDVKGEVASKGKIYKALGATAGIVLALVAI